VVAGGRYFQKSFYIGMLGDCLLFLEDRNDIIIIIEKHKKVESLKNWKVGKLFPSNL